MATSETTSTSATATVVPSNDPNSATNTAGATTTPSHHHQHQKSTMTNAATPKTPARNNYAAPNTPIASAKRPRGSTGKNNRCVSAGKTGMIPSTPVQEEEGKENMNGNSPSQSSVPSSPPMSPMHPPRPVTREVAGSEDDSVTPQSCENGAANGVSSPSSVSSSGHGSWVGRKVDALFSPVLSFLNGGAEKEEGGEDAPEDGDKSNIMCESVHTRYDEDGDVDMTPVDEDDNAMGVKKDDYREEQIEAEIKSPQSNVTTPSVEATDTSTTVSTSGSNLTSSTASTPTNSRAPVVLSTSSTEAGEVTVQAQGFSSSNNDAGVSTEVQQPCLDNTLSSEDEGSYATSPPSPTEAAIAQQQHYLPSYAHQNQQPEELDEYLDEDEEAVEGEDIIEEDNDDVSEEDDDEDDEEEFNPYLFIKTLPMYSAVVPNPHHRICLPPKNPSAPPIALVLDLDETLVHCTVEPTADADMVFPVVFNGIQYQVHVRTRPYLKEFLEAVVDKFEVIVFTASQRVYADELLDRIDPEGKYIKHRMFREACLPVEGNYLKDLNVLGRDLRKAVLVDNSPHAFGYQVDNGIPIESWFDDPNDTELLKLERFLRTLHGADDVRDLVRARFQTHRLVADA